MLRWVLMEISSRGYAKGAPSCFVLLILSFEMIDDANQFPILV